jgi:Chaperone of endosialidase
MVKASESLFALKPVTFRYKKEIDRARALSFGLIAEEVGEVSPDLITRDKDGKPETVRYEAINAMLLNEFLKEHRTVQEQSRKLENQETRIQQQDAAIAQLKEEMETLVARIKE